MAPPSPSSPPLLANRYRLERRLAQGGMAEVWLATDQALARPVAVKVLKAQLAADPVVAERFRREAVAAAGLTHPNIVAVYDTVDEGGRQAVVMQYVAGRSLRELLDEQKRLSPEMTIRIGNAVAGALDTAHLAGLVHRDVKPGNIMITPEGRVLLTDFGIAKAADGSEGDLTSDNVMMGTAKYLSPEQVRGRKLDGRADLYSLGLVLYECLAGRVPFQGETDADTALARLQRDPTPLSRLRPTLPRGLVELIHRLLARNPDDRPASGAAIQAALARVADEPPVTIDPTQRAPTPRSPIVRPPGRDVAGGGAAATSAGGNGADRSQPSGTGPRPRTARALITPPRGQPATQGPEYAATDSLHPMVPPREPTPSHGVDRPRRPARQFETRTTPALVVAIVLIVAALVVSLVLWAIISRDDGPSGGAATTAADTPATVPADQPATVPAVSTGPLTITGWHSYDPNGDGSENDVALPNLHDGSGTTTWTTQCYADKFTGGNLGVGVVVDLKGGGGGTLDVVLGGAPWALEAYTTDEANVPASFDGWGAPVDKQASNDAPNATFTLPDADATHALLRFRQLPRGANCSGVHPYQGSIGEITLTPAAA